MKLLLILTALVFVGCSGSSPAPQPPVVVVPTPTPTPSPTPVVQGVWCMTGGGFSPCAPHNPLVDQVCSIGQSLESDCKQYSCMSACPIAKSLKLKK